LIEEAIAECRVTVGFRATGPQCRQGTRYIAHGCGTQRALASDVEVQKARFEAVTSADRVDRIRDVLRVYAAGCNQVAAL